MKDSVARFTKTVDNYQKYRPGYPAGVLALLIDHCQLQKNSVIADIGSGTGILSRLFLDYGNSVYGVEPNEAMRRQAEKNFISQSKFHSVAGSAEHTTLAKASVDVITAGTAFHWFEPTATKQEFKRILKPSGWVLLVWNVRDRSTPLIRDYEALLQQFCPTYQQSRAAVFEQSAVKSFFAPFTMHQRSFPNSQQFDWAGLQGRFLSTSYAPQPGDVHYVEVIEALRALFIKHAINNTVKFCYHTKAYYGHLVA